MSNNSEDKNQNQCALDYFLLPFPVSGTKPHDQSNISQMSKLIYFKRRLIKALH